MYTLAELAAYYHIGEDSAKVVTLLSEMTSLNTQAQTQDYHFAHFFYGEAIHGQSIYRDSRLTTLLSEQDVLHVFSMSHAEFQSLVNTYKLTEPRHSHFKENPATYRFSELVVYVAQQIHQHVTDPFGLNAPKSTVTPFLYRTKAVSGSIQYDAHLLEDPEIEEIEPKKFLGHFHIEYSEGVETAPDVWKTELAQQSFTNVTLQPIHASQLMSAKKGDFIRFSANLVLGSDGPINAPGYLPYFSCTELSIETNHKEASEQKN